MRLLLRPGASLFDAMVDTLAGAGIANASMTILGGGFRHLDYCTAPPDPQHRMVVAYTAPIWPAPPISFSATPRWARPMRARRWCIATRHSATRRARRWADTSCPRPPSSANGRCRCW
ncbi:hypothetical protein WJ968_29375 [Achromobacter xylosoxidans]